MDLRKNDSALRSSCIDGNAKYDGIPFFDKIPKHRPVFEGSRCSFDDKRTQLINAFLLQRTDRNHFFSEGFFQCIDAVGGIGNSFNLIGSEDVACSQFFKLRN